MGMNIVLELTVLSSLVWISANSGGARAQLELGFYNTRCSAAESIVKLAVHKCFAQNPGVSAGLTNNVCLPFCDGSVLIDSTPGNTAEKNSPANNPSLRGFEVIDEAKNNIEAVCKGVVSCAGNLAFAARDSAFLVRIDSEANAGGVSWAVKAGRRDGRNSRASDIPGNLPPPTLNINQLTQIFAQKGLTQQEMVTLSGAHTIGRSHCSSFTNRLYNFSSINSEDPTLAPSYASALNLRCPEGNPDSTTVVNMETLTPTILDNLYYASVRANRGLFTSDQTLLTNPATANLITQITVNGFLWKSRFSAAMAKMSEIGALTGSQGEIRLNCRAIN